MENKVLMQHRTIYQMRRDGMTEAQIMDLVFHELTGWELEALDASEFPYCYDCLRKEYEGLADDFDEIVAGLMFRLGTTPCTGCGHPWDQHDRLTKEQPCVNRERAGKPFDCPCPSFTRPTADFSEPTFTVPGQLQTECPGDRVGPNVSYHEDRWPR